jgi:hypothetical protein
MWFGTMMFGYTAQSSEDQRGIGTENTAVLFHVFRNDKSKPLEELAVLIMLREQYPV